MRIHIVANEVEQSVEFMCETEGPLDQAQIEQIRKIMEKPRDSPPLTDAVFDLFRHDVEQHGLTKALYLRDFLQEEQEEQEEQEDMFYEEINQKYESTEKDGSIGQEANIERDGCIRPEERIEQEDFLRSVGMYKMKSEDEEELAQ
ncbi:hypothetical protein LTR46_011537 [Exophiala xenobiotica]|nr:hypothetical protein LTR46_011537 [Exophiala xenobiotica]